MSSLHRGKYFFGSFAIFFAIYNFLRSRQLDFESSIFAPFRYEGLLFFKNALLDRTGAFFFIRDWSTSFLKNEHPLLYFHNLDLSHFLAGLVQSYVPCGKIGLFFMALLVSVAGLWLLWTACLKNFEKLTAAVFLLTAVLPPKSFHLAPENLFIAVSLTCLAWHFRLLTTLWSSPELSRSFYLQLFFCLGVAALTETNLAVLMVLITVFFLLISSRPMFRIASMKRVFFLTLFSGLPLIFTRAIQMLAVKVYGFWDKYALDMAYTSRIKVNSDIDPLDAIAFYAKNGLTYFGDGAPQKIITNLKAVTDYFHQNFGEQLWSLTTVLALFLLVRELIRRERPAGEPRPPSPVLLLAGYLCGFTAASYALVFLSGDAMVKISLSQYGILYYPVIYTACFVCFIPSLVQNYLRADLAPWKNRALFFLIALIFVFAARHAMFKTRVEYFSYKKALPQVERDSDIITNYEPSVVAIETGSRVNMSWFDALPSSCDLLDSCRILKMYRAENVRETKHLYMFLAFFLPYGDEKPVLAKRLCLDNLEHRILYEDSYFGLYEILVKP